MWCRHYTAPLLFYCICFNYAFLCCMQFCRIFLMIIFMLCLEFVASPPSIVFFFCFFCGKIHIYVIFYVYKTTYEKYYHSRAEHIQILTKLQWKSVFTVLCVYLSRFLLSSGAWLKILFFFICFWFLFSVLN